MKTSSCLLTICILCVSIIAFGITLQGGESPSIGYYNLHPNQQINYQLNRCLTGGRLRDLSEIAPHIHNFTDWKRELATIAKKALEEGRYHNAAYYYRYSCFFSDPHDPDRAKTYDIFVSLIRNEYRTSGLKRYRIPYGKGFLPALRMTPPHNKGTIVFTSGFDTYLEEYIPRILYFASRGYDVIAFNGPGQGELLVQHRLPMIHDWEKPVRAVLNYHNLSDVTLIGVSLGGYLAMRAAAFEKRISRVVVFNVMYDFNDCFQDKIPAVQRAVLNTALDMKLDFIVDVIIRSKMKRDMLTDWFIKQGMTVTGTGSPAGFLRELRKYNVRDCSWNVKQDVLILAGSEDHYVPLRQLYTQMDALKNAKSITGRIFTKAEQAQNHGQYGNTELALGTILNWINQLNENNP